MPIKVLSIKNCGCSWIHLRKF